jgi:methylmalonyl-CoA carboxyltransferase 5S subunit
MFPQVAPKFFKTRAEGPKNVGADPAKKAAAAPAQPQSSGKPSTSGKPVSYVITLNGKEHRVTVQPSM